MTPTILVTYATEHGSTQEVAVAIAETLEEQGLQTELCPAGDVHTVRPYDAVVLGAAIYMGRLHRDARRFLRRHERVLATVPTAVFAMGPLTPSEQDVHSSEQQLEKALAKTPKVAPLSTAVFGGVVDPEKLHFPFSKMDASDARDWAAIHEWARDVSAALGLRRPAAVP